MNDNGDRASYSPGDPCEHDSVPVQRPPVERKGVKGSGGDARGEGGSGAQQDHCDAARRARATAREAFGSSVDLWDEIESETTDVSLRALPERLSKRDSEKP